MCSVKKKNVFICFLLVCVISLFLPLHTIAQTLPKYEITEEKFIEEGMLTPWVRIWVWVERKATRKQITKLIYYIYEETIIKNPKGKYTKYREKFSVKVFFDRNMEVPIAGLVKGINDKPKFFYHDWLLEYLDKKLIPEGSTF